MKIKAAYVILMLGLVPAFVCSCGNRTRATAAVGDTLYMPSYAAGFTVTRAPGGSILNITDPWQGAEGVHMQVFLAANGATAPQGFTGTVLEAPLKSVICMSSSYVAFISELGCGEAIKGISGAKYISNPDIREAYAAGKVHEVGYDAGVNFELLSVLKPDAVFAYGIAGENSVLSGKLSELGIPVVYIGDYVEQSPLGKAEWLVAFGYMLGVEEQAIESFGRMERSYNSLAQSIEERYGHGEKPVVMVNSPYRDTWFVPGDRSYMVRLITDAGGRYACAGVDSDRSRPVSIEEAYVKMQSADIWLAPGQATTMAQVRAENPRFAATPPVAAGRVYNNNKRRSAEGGSDFWESGAVRPDRVLEDMVGILHPGTVTTTDSLYYFQKLE